MAAAQTGTAVVMGEEVLVRGLGLAGVRVLPAEDPDAVRAAWESLSGDVTLVILTRAAAEALPDRDAGDRLVAVMP